MKDDEKYIKELEKKIEDLQIENTQLDNDNLVAQQVFKENAELKSMLSTIIKYFPNYEVKNFDDMHLLNALYKAEKFLEENKNAK